MRFFVNGFYLKPMLLVLMPYAVLIPMPTIAAILFVVAYNMSEWRHFLEIVKASHWTDTAVLVVTFLFTVIFDLVVAIAVGLVLAVVFGLVKKLRAAKSK